MRPTVPPESELIAAAIAGDREAYDRLASPHIRRLRAYALQMIGHPEDAADVVQDALLRGFKGVAEFRGDAAFSTWLFTITTRLCLNHLRARKRWRWDAQRNLPDVAHEAVFDDASSPIQQPSFEFDAREHIAFCFTCVSRSLPPDQEAALMLRDVFEFTNKEAAKIVGVSESVLRHALAAGRKHMQTAFEGLCAIVNKNGICYQCERLRDRMPTGSRGPSVPTLGQASDDEPSRYRHRLAVVREADLVDGNSAGLHELLLRRLAALEERAS